MLKKLLVLSAIAASTVGVTQAQSLEERVEALEYAGYENWWSFSGSLEYRYDTVETTHNKAYTTNTFNGTSVARTAGEKNSAKHHRVFTELDMAATPSKKLSFYGRLAMTKYMNTLNKGGGSYIGDGAFNELGEGQGADNSKVFFERAFVNYSFTENLTFTVGRLPTIDGAPKHFQEGRPMMGQYPLLVFGGVFDGMALTYANSHNGHAFKFRGIYTPFNQRDIGVTHKPMSNTAGQDIKENVDAYSLMAEYEKTNMSWARRIHLIYQYLHFGGLDAFTNPNASTAQASSTTNFNVTRHVLNLEMNGIANTGLSLGFSYLMGNIKGTGDFQTLGTWYGTSNTDLDGDAWIANLNYEMPFQVLRKAILGFEYINSDDDVFLYDTTAKNKVGLYTGRGGKSMHVFWMQPIDQNFKFRVGYQKSENKKTNFLGGYVGTPIVIDDEATAFYSSLQFNF